MKKRILKTNISQVNWCTIVNGIAEHVPAEIAFPNEQSHNFVSWFDSLLKGGIVLPEGNKPLSILLTGPPGSGKTTLAQELCYKLAKNEGNNPKPFSSLYISTDQESNAFIANAIDHGYPDIEKYLQPVSLKKKSKFDLQNLADNQGLVFVWGKDEIEKEWTKSSNEESTQFGMSDLLRLSFNALTGYLLNNFMDENAFRSFVKAIKGNFSRNKKDKFVPQVLVVDSLNIVEHEYKSSFFSEFMGALSHESEIVVFVMDSSPNDNYHEVWEYACDMIIRMDYGYSNEYFFRSLEIVKARYQSHVWGKHQLKLYENKVQKDKRTLKTPKEIENYNKQQKRSHPFTGSGGIFVYPSIHYYLSRYKRHEYSEYSEFVKTKPVLKDTLVGMPKGRCTAFIGARGGHKSHFGYLTCLNSIIEDRDNAALIISLRDDENTTLHTMAKIIDIEFPQIGSDNLNRYVDNNQLDILYFHPGYITPEEFFHRIFVQVQKLKRTGKHVIVMFNSLDQLQSRFPLCASQEIFIPGIIEFLSGESITSIFIAVDEPGQPIEQFGLRPMADLILSFNPSKIKARNYFNHLMSEEDWNIGDDSDPDHKKRIAEFEELIEQNPTLKQKVITIKVVRYAGGQRAGEQGILELVTKEDNLGLYPFKGLHYTKYDPKYDLGKVVS